MGGWPALAAATRAQVPRVPFELAGRRVGSVAVAHLDALRQLGAPLAVRPDGVALDADDAAFGAINDALRAQKLIAGWRGEIFTVPDPDTLAPLARIERAASRFWGTLTFGAHATGYVAGADGTPASIWIARRAFDKATDPGLFDNLVGGGVADGQTPWQALLREGFEEAGLTPAQTAGARGAGVLRVARDIAHGFQHEWLFSFDLGLPPGLQPCNQDGEVASFELLPVGAALALAAGDAMTVDAAVVTIDFAVRHRLVDGASAAAAIDALRVRRAAADGLLAQGAWGT